MSAPGRARRAVAAACVAWLAAAADAEAAREVFLIDGERSAVHFEVLHFGTSTIRGRFGGIEGHVVLDPAGGTGEVSVRIPTAGVSTGLRPFDARLRRDDLLASGAHPIAFFVGTGIDYEGGAPSAVRGDLTLRGESRRVTLRALRYGCRAEPEGRRRCGGDFETVVERSAFGADFGLGFVDDRVRLLVHVEGVTR